MLLSRLALAGLAVAAVAPAMAQRVTLVAVESDTIAENGDDNWNDNRLRAYNNLGGSEGHVDGFVKFDLSSLPDGADIVGLTLRTYHEAVANNPFNDPAVQVHRVADDSWANLVDDPYPGLNEVLTPFHQGNFPADDLVPYDWPLDATAVDWSQDLADDVLSLALRAEGPLLCYVYFYGANAPTAPPELIIDLIGPIGTSYCSPAVANSTGLPGVLTARGVDAPGGLPLTLTAADLPPGRFGYLLSGQSQGHVPGYLGSQGALCLAAPWCGFTDQVQKSDAMGTMSVDVDTESMPFTPPQAVLSGETWNFQVWYRDVNPGATSNFTDAVAILFL